MWHICDTYTNFKSEIFKKSDTWKIQLTITIRFTFSIDNDEEHKMHSKGIYRETMINDEADKVIKELFD